ncbi:MAG TPA: carboxypeptidase regulatory-like domain-containing protein, partial [Gemmatimonadales bacterium]|nr:carboxypeptidase regulatory-like domain-containing protein [Gemmatimonadales bacterium]
MLWAALAALTPSALISGATPLAAQGVTGAAIEGRIVGADSTPLEQAIVLATNSSNGERWQATTGSRGRYFLDHLSVGGPYRIEIRAVGFEPARRDSIRLALGQRLTLHFRLTPAVVQLQEITVTGTEDPRLSASRTGPALIISDSLIARLPSIGRDYTDLALLSPQVSRSPNGGLSFGGQHDRYNSMQIDGTNNKDLFHKEDAGNATLGYTPGLTSLPPEAVEELQVESAPFDVRFGNFAGGLINAVTKSGTNQVEGSILGYFESSDLVAADDTGSRGGEFSRKELGLTYGAPLVRDRVALFLDAGMQRHVTPQTVPAPSSDTTGGADSAGVGIRYQSVMRFDSLLRHHGVDPGSFSAGVNRTPVRNLFVKVTAQLGVNSRLAVSHTYGHGESQDGTLGREHGRYPFSSAGAGGPETINATRLAWTTAFGSRFSNELMLARVDDRRTCFPNSDYPFVSVGADGGELIAGTAEGCTGAETSQKVWELTDNFGLAAGDHRLTVGTHGELINLVDDVVSTAGGAWLFGNLDSLALGQANRYVRDFPNAGSQVAFRVSQIGAYVQDQWAPTPRLTLTG